MKQLHNIIFSLLFLAYSGAISQTVYTTKSGRKYHKENCRFLKYSKYQTTIEKAKRTGYTACKICNPTISNTKTITSHKQEYANPPEKKKPKKRKKASQCRGKTKSGRRCKRMTKNANKRCWQHQ